MAKKRKTDDAEPKGNWSLKIQCVVTKVVACENCTEAEARQNPWEHAVDEFEDDQIDWKVIAIKPGD